MRNLFVGEFVRCLATRRMQEPRSWIPARAAVVSKYCEMNSLGRARGASGNQQAVKSRVRSIYLIDRVGTI